MSNARLRDIGNEITLCSPDDYQGCQVVEPTKFCRLRINGRVTTSMRSDKYDNDLNVPIIII